MLATFEKPVLSHQNPAEAMLACTGTGEKFLSLLDIFHRSNNANEPIPVKRVWQLVEAGKAPEPVTHDPKYLIFAKQAGHRSLLNQKIIEDDFWREQLVGSRVVTAANDINTTVGHRPLTKTVLQKERALCETDYPKLIHASLLWLLAERNGLLNDGEYLWSELTSDLDKLRKFDDLAHKSFKPNRQYILPINFQSVDAFEVLDIRKSFCGGPKVKRVGPAMAVLHKSYAHVTLETDNNAKIPKLEKAIDHYKWVTTESLEKGKYDLNRCPLAIYWAALFNSMIVEDIGITLNAVGGQSDGVNLTALHQSAIVDDISAEQRDSRYMAKEFELGNLEARQNGYNKESVRVAMEVYGNNSCKRGDDILFVECRPGQNPRHKWQKRPRNLN